MRALVLWLVMAVAVSESGGQLKTPTRPKPVAHRVRLVYTPRQTTLSFTLGLSVPRSHKGLTDFWTRGPVGGFRLLFSCSKYFKVGAGADLSLLYFRKGTFQTMVPGVAVRAEDVALMNVFLALRLYARPTLRLSPFIEGDFGISRVTPSVYRSVMDGSPVTYYDLPGTTHLCAGLVGGFDYYLSRKVAIEIDGRALYVDGSREVGLILSANAGLKFSL